jgi:hypothetical protein
LISVLSLLHLRCCRITDGDTTKYYKDTQSLKIDNSSVDLATWKSSAILKRAVWMGWWGKSQGEWGPRGARGNRDNLSKDFCCKSLIADRMSSEKVLLRKGMEGMGEGGRNYPNIVCTYE